MKYQLVLLFKATSEADFDELISLEDVLIENLSTESFVDGHDFGSNEFNIFIFTDDPEKSFSEVEKIIQLQRPQQELRVAYRQVNQEEYVLLWPPNLKTFTIS